MVVFFCPSEMYEISNLEITVFPFYLLLYVNFCFHMLLTDVGFDIKFVNMCRLANNLQVYRIAYFLWHSCAIWCILLFALCSIYGHLFIYIFTRAFSFCNFLLLTVSLNKSRDGVSESQFNQVLNIELDQIIEVLCTAHVLWLLCFNLGVILTSKFLYRRASSSMRTGTPSLWWL